jgi:signal transduction histidine kinase
MRTSDPPYRYARLIARLSWLAVGAPKILEIADRGIAAATTASWIWLASFAAFGPALYVPAPSPRLAGAFRIGRLVVATLAAIIMVYADPRSFACALLVIIAWEMPIAMPLSVAIPWVVTQTSVVSAIMLRALPPVYVGPEIAIYLGFQGYALITAHVAHEEAEAHAELKAAQSILSQNARLSERLRLARELHDVAGHHLSALVLNLEIARHKNGATQSEVAQAQDIARHLLAEVRGIVSLTRESAGGGLRELLQQVADAIPQMNIHLTVADDAVAGHADHTRIIVRVVQETLSNAMRHADCRNAWIEVARLSDRLQITTRDDGVGTARLFLGNGLRGMRERLEEVGGSIEITPNAQPGFLVTAWLPLDEGNA